MQLERFKSAHLALTVVLVLGVILETKVHAAQAAEVVVLSMEAQPLGPALNELARQANLQLSFPATLVTGKTAPAVSGQLTVRQALDRLLVGSGLVALIDDNTVLVQLAPPSAAEPDAEILAPVTVKGRSEALADLTAQRERLASPVPKVIVDRAQIDSLGDKRLSDVAGRLPGAFAGGPPGEKKSINLRGVSSEFARFAFEGINLPSSNGSRNIDLQRISSFLVEDVTYLRSSSAEFEGDGLAGRLSFRSRLIPEDPVAEADLSLGGLEKLDGDNQSVKLGYAGRLNERFGLVAALGYDRFDSIKIKDRSELTFAGGGGPAMNLGSLIDEREPKRNDSLNLFFDFVHYHEGGEIHLRPLLLDTQVDNAGRRRDQFNRVPGTFRQRTLAGGEEEDLTTGITLSGKHTFGNGIDIDAAVAYSEAERDIRNADTTLGSTFEFASASASVGELDDELRQFNFNAAVPLRGAASGVQHRIKSGVMRRDTRQVNDTEFFTVDAAGVRSQSAANLARSLESDYEVGEDYSAAYVQDEIKFGRWTLLPGLRYERVELSTSGINATDARRNFNDLLPSLPISYRWSEYLVLRAGLAKHINRPNLGEIAPGVSTRGPRTFTGNPDLVPAESRSFDIGFDYSKDNIFLGLNLFERDIEDLIETLEPTIDNFVFRNVGDGVIRGIELEQRFRLATWGPRWLQNLSVSANQAFLESRVDDPTTGPRPFAEQPKFIANLILEYDPAPTGFAASFGINHIGERGIISNEGGGAIRDKTIKSETFVDARVAWRFSPTLEIYARAENITNQPRDEFEFLNGELNRIAVIETGSSYFLGLIWRL